MGPLFVPRRVETLEADVEAVRDGSIGRIREEGSRGSESGD